MSDEKTTLEIIAPSVEEAVAKGLEQLGLDKEAVEIDVLDEGSRGLFGLGGRQARIRLTIKPPSTENQATASPIRSETTTQKPPSRQDSELTQQTEKSPDEEDALLQLVIDVVTNLLEKMKVRASVTAKYIQPEDENDDRLVMVDISGNDLSILIGRRSETLNALQYITGLIVNKKMGRLVPLMIDVQGYRARREGQLRQLARRMAEQAIQTGRRQILEPMPPNERRLIHLELRGHDKVVTESIGEDANRKVTIRLKK